MVSPRFLRHMQIVTIDSFADETLNKIFCSILDWHLAKGFEENVSRLTKVTLLNLPNKSFQLFDSKTLNIFFPNILSKQLCSVLKIISRFLLQIFVIQFVYNF